MEENVQRIFSVMIAVLIFFILPMYMAFEKKDDISYALALRITTNFVDNVQSKGYMSRKMYDQFVNDLAITDNIYEISMQHLSKKYNPAIYIYDNNDNSKLIKKLDYNIYRTQYLSYKTSGNFLYNSVNYTNITLSYDLDEVIYNEKQILDVLDRTVSDTSNKLIVFKNYDGYIDLTYTDIPSIVNMYGSADNNSIYTMSIGDEFTIIIKNLNVTIASVLFNSFTLGMNSNNNTKIYINYGSTILNESYN